MCDAVGCCSRCSVFARRAGPRRKNAKRSSPNHEAFSKGPNNFFKTLKNQPFEVERNIVQTALSELDNVMKMNLVKISNATHFRDKLEDREIKLVEDAFSHNNGKWYFQPDQRSRTETFFIQKDPCIARNVLPFKEWSELNNSTKGEN